MSKPKFRWYNTIKCAVDKDIKTSGFREEMLSIADAIDKEIDSLQEELSEYKSATVVEVDDKTECPLCDGELSYCHLDKDEMNHCVRYGIFYGSKTNRLPAPQRRGNSQDEEGVRR